MGEFSLTHLLLIAVIFLLFFGPSRLPQLGQSLGKAIRGFKQGLNEIDAEARDISNDQLTHDKQTEMKTEAKQTDKTKPS
jgi:sec-independent protein translocase protein TatA